MTLNLKPVLKIIAINVAVLIGLLVVCEIALRLFFPLERYGVSRTVSQSIPGIKRKIEYSEIAPFIRARSAGSLKKPPDTIRILCVGGSTTQQTTQETGDTWCGLLEEKLRAALGADKRIETLSYGKGGETSFGTGRRLQSLEREIEPDIVVTLLGVNDLFINGGPGYRVRHVKTARRRWPKCSEYSHVCRLFKQAKAGLDARIKLRQGTAVEWHSKALPARRANYRSLPYVERLNRDPDPIDEFKANVNWILGFLKDRDVGVVVLGQPVLWKPGMTKKETGALWFGFNTPEGRVRPSGDWLQSEMRRYNEAQAVIAERHGFSFVDLDTQIPKTLEYFFDDCHFTDKGSRKVAEVVFPAVKKRVETLLAGRRK